MGRVICASLELNAGVRHATQHAFLVLSKQLHERYESTYIGSRRSHNAHERNWYVQSCPPTYLPPMKIWGTVRLPVSLNSCCCNAVMSSNSAANETSKWSARAAPTSHRPPSPTQVVDVEDTNPTGCVLPQNTLHIGAIATGGFRHYPGVRQRPSTH